MSHLLTLLLLGGLFVAGFYALNIKFTRKNITIATLIFVFTMTVGLVSAVLWSGGAPVSHQITLTRFVVGLNPDLKALIKTINVKIGQHVKKGDLLFELDQLQFQAPVDQYAADLEAAKKEVDRLKAASELADASIKRAIAQRATAKSKRDAQVELRAKGSAAVRELKVFETERNFDAATASVLEAKASKHEAEAAIASGIAKIKSVQGQLDKARSDLVRTSQRAPADGVMINWQGRPGTITSALRSSAVGTFMETGDTRIVIILPQNLLRNVAIGDPVEIAFMSRPGHIDFAKIIRIANYSGEGQFTATGDVPVLADVASRGYFAAVAKLDDEKLARSLGLGEAGTAAIYTQSSTLFHILSRIQIRLVALLLYLP
jgi:multidrug resistance efflux pump